MAYQPTKVGMSLNKETKWNQTFMGYSKLKSVKIGKLSFYSIGQKK